MHRQLRAENPFSKDYSPLNAATGNSSVLTMALSHASAPGQHNWQHLLNRSQDALESSNAVLRTKRSTVQGRQDFDCFPHSPTTVARTNEYERLEMSAKSAKPYYPDVYVPLDAVLQAVEEDHARAAACTNAAHLQRRRTRAEPTDLILESEMRGCWGFIAGFAAMCCRGAVHEGI